MKTFLKHILIITLVTSLANAEYIMPGDVSVSTVAYKPKHTDFNRGNYSYKVSWQGIPVATAEISVNDPDVDGIWKVNAGAKTNDWISTFYTLSFKSESTFSKNNFRPLQFISNQTENSKKKVKQVSFDQDGTITTQAYKNGKKEETLSFRSDNKTLDPISAAFLARSLDIKVGSKKSFDVFNGKNRYLITFNVEGREKLKVGKNRELDCFTVIPEVVKLTDTEGEKRLKSAKIWITADDKRDIIKIESSVLVGKVKAEFVKFTPDPLTLVRNSPNL